MMMMMNLRGAVVVVLTSLLVAQAAADTADGNNNIIVDLSVEFETSDLDNPGNERINAVAAADPLIVTALVLERGKIVAEYVREDVVDPATATFHLWSSTKSWTSLLIVLLIESGKLSLDETLGEIWPDNNNNTVWTDIPEADFRKNVTVQDLLTMSSGLVDPSDFNVATANITYDGVGGSSVESSLSWPDIGEKGVFSYLAFANILSYVILERSGMTPREYANAMVFPSLGIDDSALDWWQNGNGVENAYYGLLMTSRQMAKFGQLYLQNGFAAPADPLVSAEWVNASSARQTEIVDPGFPPRYYGYLFWVINGTWVGDPDAGEFYCAIGAFGQDMCIHPELGRVSIQQRENSMDLLGNFVTTGVAFNKSLSFTNDDDDDTSAGMSWRQQIWVPVTAAGWLMLASLGLY